MNDERITYVDSSAIVKLVVSEPESVPLRRFLKRRRPIVSSALARTEVVRAMLPLGAGLVEQAHKTLDGFGLLRVNDRVLRFAGALEPNDLRSLDAIHLATATLFGSSLGRLVTYDHRMTQAAAALGWPVIAPS